jgi:hypothetical protein
VELGPSDRRLFYEAAGGIGEARSVDGLSWERLGSGPVLAPDAVSPDAFDAASVGDPEAWLARTAEGRRVVRVYYTGAATDGASAIGLAARFESEGALTRAPAPAFASSRGPHAAAVVPHAGLTLLFVTQRSGVSDDWPAIAVGLAPATRRIPVD